jgi:primosomal protein N' (replication factor Y)
MSAFCEVALPVPLDRVFTYAVRAGQRPQRGARVIVPFRNEKLIGVVTGLSAKVSADFEVRDIEVVLDDEPLLSDHLLELAEWMAQYYLAPLGEVLRGMLPLMAEVRRTLYYRITDLGRDILADSVEADLPQVQLHQSSFLQAQEASQLRKSGSGAPMSKRRGKLSAEEQNLERRVLARLAEGGRSKSLPCARLPLPHCRCWHR